MAFNAFKGGGAWGSKGGAWGNSKASARYEDDEEAPTMQSNGLFATSIASSNQVHLEVDQQGGRPAPSAPPAPYQSGFGAPPPGSLPPVNPGVLSELNMREQELKRKEDELRRREDDLRRLQNSNYVEKKRNWPTERCAIMYHDIGEEVQPSKRGLVRWAYICYLTFCVLVFWQFLCVTAMALMFRGNISSWFLAAIYLVIGIPGALFLWYKRIYELGKSGSGHIRALLFLLVHFGFCVYCAIAIPMRSSAAVDGGAVTGWLSMSSAFSRRRSLGFMYLFGALGWTFESVLSFLVLGWIYKDFRGRT